MFLGVLNKCHVGCAGIVNDADSDDTTILHTVADWEWESLVKCLIDLDGLLNAQDHIVALPHIIPTAQ